MIKAIFSQTVIWNAKNVFLTLNETEQRWAWDNSKVINNIYVCVKRKIKKKNALAIGFGQINFIYKSDIRMEKLAFVWLEKAK